MKQQAIQYVALDVHQATVVVSVRDEQGSIAMRATVPTEAKAIIGLVRGLGTRVHVVFEEGPRRSGCTTYSNRTRSECSSVIPADAARVGTRAIGSMPIGSPSCCVSDR